MKSFKRIALSLAAATFSVLLVGCVAPVQKTSFINDDGFNHLRNAKDFKFRSAAELQVLRRPDVLYVSPPVWLHKKDVDKNEREELGKFIQEYFYHALLDERYAGETIFLKREKSLEPYRDKGLRCLRLESAVTRVKEGNGLMRYLVGFYMGQTDLQIEGRLIDDRTGDEIMAFVSRKRHAGDSHNGMNPRALSSEYCLKLSIEEAVLQCADVIKDVWDGAERTGRSDALQLLAMER